MNLNKVWAVHCQFVRFKLAVEKSQIDIFTVRSALILHCELNHEWTIVGVERLKICGNGIVFWSFVRGDQTIIKSLVTSTWPNSVKFLVLFLLFRSIFHLWVNPCRFPRPVRECLFEEYFPIVFGFGLLWRFPFWSGSWLVRNYGVFFHSFIVLLVRIWTWFFLWLSCTPSQFLLSWFLRDSFFRGTNGLKIHLGILKSFSKWPGLQILMTTTRRWLSWFKIILLQK